MLHIDYTEITQRLHRYYTEVITHKIHRDYTEITQRLHRNYTEITQRQRYTGTERLIKRVLRSNE